MAWSVDQPALHHATRQHRNIQGAIAIGRRLDRATANAGTQSGEASVLESTVTIVGS